MTKCDLTHLIHKLVWKQEWILEVSSKKMFRMWHTGKENLTKNLAEYPSTHPSPLLGYLLKLRLCWQIYCLAFGFGGSSLLGPWSALFVIFCGMECISIAKRYWLVLVACHITPEKLDSIYVFLICLLRYATPGTHIRTLSSSCFSFSVKWGASWLPKLDGSWSWILCFIYFLLSALIIVAARWTARGWGKAFQKP